MEIWSEEKIPPEFPFVSDRILSKNSDGVVRKDISDNSDRESIRSLLGMVEWIQVYCPDWTMIPLENLIADASGTGTRICAEINRIEDIQGAIFALEIGVDALLLPCDEDMWSKAQLLRSKRDERLVQNSNLEMIEVTIDSIEDGGIGERVCIDLIERMKPDEGLCIGSFSSCMVLVQAEVNENPHVPTRPFRVNAGAIPSNHWVHKPNQGGGRILGEVCHFVDLARFFANSPITSVYGEASNGNSVTCDNVIVSLTFANESLATILYTAHGDMSEGKEYYEIFSGGKNFKLNDFRELEITKPKRIYEKIRTQDKGHHSSINAFINAVKNQGPAPISQAELIETTSSTISILTSIKSGKRITL